MLGGTISEIGGGKFANGAVTGAYSMLFNHLKHNWFDKIKTGSETSSLIGFTTLTTKTKFSDKEIKEYLDKQIKIYGRQNDILSTVSTATAAFSLKYIAGLAIALESAIWSDRLGNLISDYNRLRISYGDSGGKQGLWMVATTVTGGAQGHSINVTNYNFYKPNGTRIGQIVFDQSH